MRRYLAHMHEKTPHERRQHASSVAGIVTAFIFIGWLVTLGARLSAGSGSTVVTDVNGVQQTQLAAVAAAGSDASTNTLVVATTTDDTIPQ